MVLWRRCACAAAAAIMAAAGAFRCEHPGCGERFRRLLDLTRHERSHTPSGEVPCATCGRTFRYSSHLHLYLTVQTCSRALLDVFCERRGLPSSPLQVGVGLRRRPEPPGADAGEALVLLSVFIVVVVEIFAQCYSRSPNPSFA